MKFNLIFIISLVVDLIILVLAFYWTIKEKKPEPIIATVSAFLSIFILFFSSYNNEENFKELETAYKRQNDILRDTLLKQIDQIKLLEVERDSLKKQIVEINGTNNTTILGNDNQVISYNKQETPIVDTSYQISGFYKTNIYLSRGNKVFISASGSIRVGDRVGHSGPEGKDGGVFGWDISYFNLIENYKHAALIFKYTEENEWIYCGSSYVFTASHDGALYFEINDRIKSDNSGYYDVNVKVYR